MNANMDKFANHLESLGYKVEKLEAKNKGELDRMVATHSQKHSISILSIDNNISLFGIVFGTEKEYNPEMDNLMNEINKIIFGKASYSIDEETQKVIFKLVAPYTSDYKKEAFETFFNLFYLGATLQLGEIPNFKKVFID